MHRLISEIQNNPAAVSALAALVSAIVALIAVVGGLIMSNRQVRVSVRSTNRQAWINELRNQIAEALSLLTEAMATKKSNIAYEERVKTLVRYDLHFPKVQLLINPQEEDHRDLCKNLANAMIALNKIPGSGRR
jgi:hypothetical protein